MLNNTPSHLANDKLKDGNIKALFLPVNIISVRQNQGILEAPKKKISVLTSHLPHIGH